MVFLLSAEALFTQRLATIRAGFTQRLSATAIYNATKGSSIGMRKTEFLNLARAVKVGRDSAIQFTRLKPQQKLDPSLMGTAQHPMAKEYRYTIKLDIYFNKARGYETKWAIFNSDVNLSPEALEALAEEEAARILGPSEGHLRAQTVTNILRRE